MSPGLSDRHELISQENHALKVIAVRRQTFGQTGVEESIHQSPFSMSSGIGNIQELEIDIENNDGGNRQQVRAGDKRRW